MSTSTDRQTFRATVAQVAEKARAVLPQAVNGRVESAVKLVLGHDVAPQPDGSILVGSSTDPLKTYHLVGSTCECQDFTYGKAPDGWCAHRIAAGIHKRVGEVLAAQAPTVEPEPVPPAAGEKGPASAPATGRSRRTPALPEAPVSITLKASLHGYEALVTLRGTDFASVQAQVEQAATWLRSQAPVQASSTGEGWCALHNTAMKRQQKGERSWYSHWLEDGSWCKGKTK